MGKGPKTSVSNKWNQVHEAPNVFVTDGAAMTSSACQNPSLTYMALTTTPLITPWNEKGMSNHLSMKQKNDNRAFRSRIGLHPYRSSAGWSDGRLQG
ncbi:MAG: GMC oxidoreductase [Chthoniobacteraceae bacterium]